MEKFNTHFFPGGNTTDGFYSYYNQLTNKNQLDRIYTIKGGPGVGKSTFMKDIAEHFDNKGFMIEYYHCSSDPDSLDAVIIKEKKLMFVDGTAPHIIDPVYPGVLYEMINLADFYDNSKLMPYKNQIIDLTDNISDIFKQSYNYLKSLKNIKNNLEAQYKKALKSNDLNTFSKILTKRIAKGKQGYGYGEQKQFISAITPSGLRNYIDINTNFSNIFVLNSQVGDLTYKITESVKNALKQNNFSFKSLYCPTAPDTHIEHIFIPELDCALITSNKYHQCFKGEIIETNHLYDCGKLNKDEIEYETKLYESLLEKTVSILQNAKKAHDRLEKYYISAMDFYALDSFKKEFISSISI